MGLASAVPGSIDEEREPTTSAGDRGRLMRSITAGFLCKVFGASLELLLIAVRDSLDKMAD